VANRAMYVISANISLFFLEYFPDKPVKKKTKAEITKNIA
jgi:hypothetical protein